MTFPLWVPWVLALALALPVLLRRSTGGPTSRGVLAVLLVPAVGMALYAAWSTLDRQRVTQDELDAATGDAASTLDGSLGPVNDHEVADLVADDLGRDVWAERSDLAVPDELSASYTIEVRMDEGSDDPAACVDVALEVLDPDAPDLRLADVTARSGSCD